MNRRRGLGHRIGQWCCWAIGVETIGGLAWYAILAGSYLTVLLLLALAGIGWKANHHRRRRARAAWAGRTGPAPWQ